MITGEMNLEQNVRQLLTEVGPGRMTNSAYDTAWVARLDAPIGKRAREWLRAHQLADGSWGAPKPRYYHDRVLCTLAAMTALARRGQVQDDERLRRAQTALESAIQRLGEDAAGETVGFEMIAPTLLDEAKALGIFQYNNGDILDGLRRKRTAKLKALPSGMINRSVTVAFSAEMAGADGGHLFDVENLTEANGSVALSPSATTYYLLHVRCQDRMALGYLHEVVDRSDGGVPNLAPIELYERAWVLWNLALAGPLESEVLAWCEPHLDVLEAAWDAEKGIGFSTDYTPKDGDDTSVAHEVLTYFGRSPNLNALLHYKDTDHFRCYPLEANASPSVNAHFLSALRQTGADVQHPSIQTILQYLRRTQSPYGAWFDKWHASPYYTTAHVIISCAGYDDDLIGNAVSWILETQNADGSWGRYLPTAEETAYCLQALVVWKRHGGQVAGDVLRRGIDWLVDHAEPSYPPLWIGKCLYCPELIVRSAILSALMLAAQK